MFHRTYRKIDGETTENMINLVKTVVINDDSTQMLNTYKKFTNKDIPPILPKFFKKNGNWVGLLPDDEGYEDH